jgi:hypothetical protein
LQREQRQGLKPPRLLRFRKSLFHPMGNRGPAHGHWQLQSASHNLKQARGHIHTCNREAQRGCARAPTECLAQPQASAWAHFPCNGEAQRGCARAPTECLAQPQASAWAHPHMQPRGTAGLRTSTYRVPRTTSSKRVGTFPMQRRGTAGLRTGTYIVPRTTSSKRVSTFANTQNDELKLQHFSLAYFC